MYCVCAVDESLESLRHLSKLLKPHGEAFANSQKELGANPADGGEQRTMKFDDSLAYHRDILQERLSKNKTKTLCCDRLFYQYEKGSERLTT